MPHGRLDAYLASSKFQMQAQVQVQVQVQYKEQVSVG